MQALANSCGACTMCCRLTAVPELDKPVNVWCPHCDVGKGCRIYATRPDSCSRFACMWLKEGWVSALRPDRCKVMFEKLPGKDTVLALMAPERSEAWKSPRVKPILARLIQAGHPIVTASGSAGNKNVLLPKEKTERDVWLDLGITAPVTRMVGGSK